MLNAASDNVVGLRQWCWRLEYPRTQGLFLYNLLLLILLTAFYTCRTRGYFKSWKDSIKIVFGFLAVGITPRLQSRCQAVRMRKWCETRTIDRTGKRQMVGRRDKRRRRRRVQLGSGIRKYLLWYWQDLSNDNNSLKETREMVVKKWGLTGKYFTSLSSTIY